MLGSNSQGNYLWKSKAVIINSDTEAFTDTNVKKCIS